jgi:putative acetyltransferase
VIIRPERSDDAAAIREILIAAFPSMAEADLVERLRRGNDLALTLVAEQDGEVPGYVAFPKLTVRDAGRTYDTVGLAPVAVMPDRQRLGIGGALIRAGHRLLAAHGASLIFVLGEPDYYTRFGYGLDAAAPFDSVYAGPHFMALRLSEVAPRAGKVRYPAAFSQLG